MNQILVINNNLICNNKNKRFYIYLFFISVSICIILLFYFLYSNFSRIYEINLSRVTCSVALEFVGIS